MTTRRRELQPVPGDTRRLLTGKYCIPHKGGVPAGMPPFFVAGCTMCESKKARGIVRGDEGPPPKMREKRAREGGRMRRMAMLRIKTKEPGATL